MFKYIYIYWTSNGNGSRIVNPPRDFSSKKSEYSHPPNIKHPHCMVPFRWKFPTSTMVSRGIFNMRKMGLPISASVVWDTCSTRSNLSRWARPCPLKRCSIFWLVVSHSWLTSRNRQHKETVRIYNYVSIYMLYIYIYINSVVNEIINHPQMVVLLLGFTH